MYRYALASQFWRVIPAGWAQGAWQRRGQRMVTRAAGAVPAYRTLLLAFGGRPAPTGSGVAGAHRPLMVQTSPASYVQVFPAEQRGRRGWERQVVSFDPLAPQGHRNDAWPRASDELRTLREQLVGLLSGCFDTRQRRTLLLADLPPSGWSASRRIAQPLQEAIGRGRLRGSLVEVPEDLDQVEQTVRRLGGQFDQCVLLCDPIRATACLNRLAGLTPQTGVVVFGPFSAQQRALVPPDIRMFSVWGIDEVAPLMAMETPLTHLLAEACATQPDLEKTIFPAGRKIIGLYQPFPAGPWLEQVGGTLLVSSWGAFPTIRYRLRQGGTLIGFAEICRLLEQYQVRSRREVRRLRRAGSTCWKLPVIALSDA